MGEPKKVLFTAKVDSHILAFHIPYLKYFKDRGYKVYVASEGESTIPYCDEKINMKFGIKPWSRDVKIAKRKLVDLYKKNDFDIVHTHTAISSVLTRSVHKKYSRGSRVIYTSHGFHFKKGGSLLHWLLYYPVEYYYSRFTTDLVLINNEDYQLAKKRFRAKRIFQIPGVGVALEKFSNAEPIEYIDGINLKERFVITYVAELNSNKNQLDLIKSIQLLIQDYPDILLILVGEGRSRTEIENYITKHHLKRNVILTGYRNDVPNILKATSLYVSSSKREGLGLNLIEAIAAGNFVIAFNGRGHDEIVIDGVNGWLINHSVNSLVESIKNFLISKPNREDKELLETIKRFSSDEAYLSMKLIYEINREN